MKTLGSLVIIAVLVAAIFGVASKELSSVLADYTSAGSGQVITVIPNGLVPSSANWQGATTSPGTGSSTSTGTGSGSSVTTSSISNTTANWAGYSATGGTYTSVSGSWVVPKASGIGTDSADAAWVGIGGVSSSDLIQAGTQNIVSASGEVQTTAFYELLPDTSRDVTTINVNPGDNVTVSINQTSEGEWSISIKDNTNGQSFNTNVAYDSSLSSAEWIEEDPSDGQSQIPFDNFSSIQFSGGQTTDNGSTVNIAGADGQALIMVSQDGTELATTSGLGSNGSSFTVSQASLGTDQLSYGNATPGSLMRSAVGLVRFRDNVKF